MSFLPLAGALVLLLVDSAIELALISSMVGYLHRSGANKYPFNFQGAETIQAKPAGLLVDQGHTSNGAAGTALVTVCIGGYIVLWLERRRAQKSSSQGPSKLFRAYAIFTVISAIFTLAALAYTFALTNSTKHHTINKAIAARTPADTRYPLDKWTPETWTKALLALPITSSKDAAYLRHWLKVMEGWKWNLIPMFLLGLTVAILSVHTYLSQSRAVKSNHGQKTTKKFGV